MKKKMALALLVVLAGLGIWYFTTRNGAGEARILETARVERGDVRKALEATGIIKPQVGAQVKIGSRVTGVLSSVPVKVGDRVKAGDLVAEIDSRELRARRAQAEAQYNLARAKLINATKDLERKRILVGKKIESQSVLDEASEKASVARFDTEAAQASMDSLDVQLSYTRVYSPIDGVVSQVTAQEGETVVAGFQVANLITVLDPTRLEMWIYVDETDVGRAVPGLPVEFTVDAYPGTVFTGSLDRIYPEPEIRDNIVYYRALVTVGTEDAGKLRPEMTTQCKIVVETRRNVLTIPNTALKWVDGRQVVFVRGANGSPVKVTPKLGLQGLMRSEVLEGLDEGAEVAVQVVLPGQKKSDKGS